MWSFVLVPSSVTKRCSLKAPVRQTEVLRNDTQVTDVRGSCCGFAVVLLHRSERFQLKV